MSGSYSTITKTAHARPYEKYRLSKIRFNFFIYFPFFTEDIIERVEVIIHHFTFLLYQNVCRSLFERHKLLFALILCIRIAMDKGVIRGTEFNFLMNGAAIDQVNSPYVISYKGNSDMWSVAVFSSDTSCGCTSTYTHIYG